MELKFMGYKERKDDGKVYTRNSYQINEYNVNVDVIHYEDGSSYRNISVNAKDWGKDYIPQIYYEEPFERKSDAHFEVQTTAYGSLRPEEIDKVIAGYQQAKETAEILTKEFC